MGYLTVARAELGFGLTTPSMNVDFLETATEGAWVEVVLDEPTRITRHFAFLGAKVVSDGRLLARASAVFAVANRKDQGT